MSSSKKKTKDMNNEERTSYSSMIMDASIQRTIPVVEPECPNGNIEYKRQVQGSNTGRLRSLATQMSYRLDQGNGTCLYRIGVEDDGCHSLLDYTAIAESCRIIECIARSLNSIVAERTIIQNEIMNSTVSNQHEDGSSSSSTSSSGTSSRTPQKASPDTQPIIVIEPNLFGDAYGNRQSISTINEKEHKMDGDDSNGSTTTTTPERIIIQQRQQRQQLVKDPGVYTRAEITIQRVETHLLDPSPLSLEEITNATELLTMDSTDTTAVTSPIQNGATAFSSSSSQQSGSDTGNGTGSVTTTIPAAVVGGGSNHTSTSFSVGETLSSRNIRVAVVGNVDAGKSTLIGTLTTSCLDDGRGKSRTAIMKHRHEIESGRTSTATTHLMGFRATGEPITGRDKIRAMKRKGEDEIARESYRVITLMDLAGHEKYLKTTIHGVSSGFADHALILVNARQPPTHMTQHHLNLCCSFGIPVIVVFTKIDSCPEHAYKTSKEEVMKMLRSGEVGKKPYSVRNENDIMTVIEKLHTLAPMIETSCVTGDGIELLQKLLFALPKRRRHENKMNRKFEFLVEDNFNVPGVGAVVSGFVNSGNLTVGANCYVYIGPLDDGTFLKTVAKSAHIARINTGHITAGQSACLALSLNKDYRKKLRRGMVVVTEAPSSTREFDAEICVLKGEGTTIRRSYQAYVHILNVRQSAFARKIELVTTNHTILTGGASGTGTTTSTTSTTTDPTTNETKDDDDNNNNNNSATTANTTNTNNGIVLRPGSRARVRFEFAKRPEYIRPGMRMLFRDGRVRGVGIITSIHSIPAQITVK